MTKPTQVPNWATDTNYPADAAPEESSPTKVAPTLGQATIGWRPKARPPAREMNWWKNLVGRWTAWLDSIFDAFDNLTPQVGASITLRNAPAWTASTAYAVGDIIAGHAGNMYVCITAGTSDDAGDGPTTTAADITDGTAHWKFLTDSDGQGRLWSEGEEYLQLHPAGFVDHAGVTSYNGSGYREFTSNGNVAVPIALPRNTRILRVIVNYYGAGDLMTVTLNKTAAGSNTSIKVVTGSPSAGWANGLLDIVPDTIEDGRIDFQAWDMTLGGTTGARYGGVTIIYDRSKPPA